MVLGTYRSSAACCGSNVICFTEWFLDCDKASAYDRVVLVLYGVLFYSLAAGIVEEMVFRGLIMGTMEREYNLTAAVRICSYYWK